MLIFLFFLGDYFISGEREVEVVFIVWVDVEVSLGGGDFGVSEEFLDVGDGSVTFEKVGGAGVAEDVRGEVVDLGFLSESFHEATDVCRADAFSCSADK